MKVIHYARSRELAADRKAVLNVADTLRATDNDTISEAVLGTLRDHFAPKRRNKRPKAKR